MGDYINRRSLLDVFTSVFFGKSFYEQIAKKKLRLNHIWRYKRCSSSLELEVNKVTPYVLGLDPRNVDGNLEEEMYSDEEDDDFYPYTGAYRLLEPHPRIRQLTDEVFHFHYMESETKSSLDTGCCCSF